MLNFDQDTIDKHLDTCLTITSFFEGGTFKVNYSNITGNFDGQGLSVGTLQWAAGQGSLSKLLKTTLQYMSEDDANNYFKSYGDHVISNMASMSAQQCKNFCLANFIDVDNKVKTLAVATWRDFLNDPGCVKAQRDLAENDVLKKAYDLVEQYYSQDTSNLRAIAFFFDVVTQSGSMSNSRGSVSPVTLQDDLHFTQAIDEARAQGKTWTADQWLNSVNSEDISKILLHYAYDRSRLSSPQWQWNALVRRGTLATRFGYVNGVKVDLTKYLP